jgi:hypothetical protein
MENKLTCKICNNEKSITEFIKIKGKPYHNCIKCKSEYVKKYKKEIQSGEREKLQNAIINNTKTCIKCEQTKNVSEFPIRTDTKQGYKNTCKVCIQINMNEYYQIKYNEVRRERKKTDPKYKLISNHRTYLYKCVRKNKLIKKNKSIEYLGCTIEFLKEWLESQFDNKMSWDNYGKYWTIDHILPLSKFNYKNSLDEKIAFHWTNLQPLVDNFAKSDNIRPSEFYNVITKTINFMLLKKNYDGYQVVFERIQWLRNKLRYGKNPSDN